MFCKAPGAVGMSGARMYMYYVEVVPEQKVGDGACFNPRSFLEGE